MLCPLGHKLVKISKEEAIEFLNTPAGFSSGGAAGKVEVITRLLEGICFECEAST